jgi:hypothetical protein
MMDAKAMSLSKGRWERPGQDPLGVFVRPKIPSMGTNRRLLLETDSAA